MSAAVAVHMRKDPMMSKTRVPGALVVALGVATFSWLWGGCTEDHPCDDGQILQSGYCVPEPTDAAPTGPFGQPCTTSAECPAPTNFCSIVPPSSSGNCTASGCATDPSVCPATWTCFDLTPYGQALQICIPPTS